MSSYDIIIIGVGPAGSAAALEIATLDRALVGNVLVIDKAIFPRRKLCAGGLSVDSDEQLRCLGVEPDVAAVPVHRTQFILPTGRLTFTRPNQFRVVRRTDFDEFLVRAAQARGVVVCEGEQVTDVVAGRDQVIVRTEKTEYVSKILIAADGANSTVRARLRQSRVGRLMIAMELHATLADLKCANVSRNMAVLDLSVLDSGLPGYCWMFPAVNEDRPTVSMGIMAAPHPGSEAAHVKSVFGQWLSGYGLDIDRCELASHPCLRYEPTAPCSHNRVLFAGDAAGAEPLFGEGIVSALAVGRIAAKSAIEALRRNDFSFADYGKHIGSSRIGSLMRRRRMIARRLYARPKLASFFLHRGMLIRGLALLQAKKYGGDTIWESLAG